MFKINLDINGDIITFDNVQDLYNINIKDIKCDDDILLEKTKIILQQIQVNNNIIAKNFFQYTRQDNRESTTLKKYNLNNITIWDLLKTFGVDNIQVQKFTNNMLNVTPIHQYTSSIITQNLHNIYNKRLYNIDNKSESNTTKINKIILNQHYKKESLKKEIVDSILNMRKLEYLEKEYNTNVLSDIKQLNIPNISNKVKSKNINVFENLKGDENIFELYKNKMASNGVILHKHKINNMLYVGLSIGEDEDLSVNYEITDVYYKKYNIPYMNKIIREFDEIILDVSSEPDDIYFRVFESDILYETSNAFSVNTNIKSDIVKYINILNKYSILDSKGVIYDQKPYFCYKVFKNVGYSSNSIKSNIVLDRINNLEKLHIDKSYNNYIKFIISKYVLDNTNITFRDVIEESDPIQKYFGKVYFSNKTLYTKIYLTNIYNNLVGVFNKYLSFNEIIKDNLVDEDNEHILRHLYSEYLIAKDYVENTQKTYQDEKYTENKMIDFTQNKNPIKDLNSKIREQVYETLHNGKLNIIKANTNVGGIKYLTYLIPLGQVIEYIDIEKINPKNIYRYLGFHNMSDYVYKDKNIKLYDENNLKKIKQFKDKYLNNTDSFKCIYKETNNTKTGLTGINANYNITFKVKNIDKKIKKFTNYKNNLELIENNLDISNIINTIPLISVEDMNNQISKYANLYVNSFSKNIVYNKSEDTQDPLDLDLLRVQVYQKCYKMFNYVIPIKRKVDIYSNSEENNKLDIIFFNDIKNIGYITDIFIKNKEDLRIFKSKYKYCRSISKKVECYYKDRNEDKEFKKIEIDYEDYLRMKYKEGKIFDKYHTLFEKDFENFIKNKNNNLYFKIFKTYKIPFNLLVCDISVKTDTSGETKGMIQIGGNLLKNIHTIKAICFTLFNMTLHIYDRFGRYLEFKNFNVQNMSFDVYEGVIKLGRIFINSTITKLNDESVVTKTLENQIIELIIK